MHVDTSRRPVGPPASNEATMKPRSLLYLLAAALSFSLVSPCITSATTYVLQPWQALVATADLVGVIECVTAAEVVARYRVVESWKGPPAGTEVLVRGFTSGWEPTLPIALCGDRLLVAAWNPRSNHGQISYGSVSGGSGEAVPAWWRQERPDFVIPSPLHFTVLSPGQRRSNPPNLFGGYEGPLGSLRKEAAALFALDEEAREAAVLRALVQWHVVAPRSRSRRQSDPEAIRKLGMRMRSSDIDSIVSAIIDHAKRRRDGSVAIEVLGMGGGPRTLTYL